MSRKTITRGSQSSGKPGIPEPSTFSLANAFFDAGIDNRCPQHLRSEIRNYVLITVRIRTPLEPTWLEKQEMATKQVAFHFLELLFIPT